MTRRRRLQLPGTALHIIQRGNNRQCCFVDDRDRLQYLETLSEAAAVEQVAIHAWVLMGNHVHLLATPLTSGAASRMMQAVGRSYVRAFNLRRQRTGTLWEGRFRSSLVDDGAYVLACYRYVELNPVRAGLVAHAEQYRWSSYAANALNSGDGLVQPHPEYLALAESEVLRRERYRDWLEQKIDPAELEAIRIHTKQQRLWGKASFQAEVEAATGQQVRVRPRGRPKKISDPISQSPPRKVL